MSLPAKPKYGELSWTQYLGIVATLVPLPVVLLWKVVTTYNASYNKERSVKRFLGDSTLRYSLTHLSVPQLQRLMGTTLRGYQKWTTQSSLPPVIDELGEDARLLWIGPKQLDRVVLICHGGAFLLPATGFCLSFWRYVQTELEKKNIKVGFALLNYSLAPQAPFPTQLNQARLALEFLFAAGVKPQNLQLVGDSAGANLILQILSQTLHPLERVPEIHFSAPIRGAHLISPCVSLTADSASHTENDGVDFLSKSTAVDWGNQILAPIPEADRPFAEAAKAPEGWFKGVDRLVDRVLVTAGGAEILRDDIVYFGDSFKKHHPNTELVVQKDGLHEDMYLDFLVKEKKLGSLTPLTVEWLAAGFAATS
ncbi:Alpha/Beta hydrolase protein [Mycena sp. CBHHK59/15]|nr:Alpha/Beta hydrolase protein [Mycena sp. CBHHK59/15]